MTDEGDPMHSLTKMMAAASLCATMAACTGPRSPTVQQTRNSTIHADATTQYGHSMGYNFPARQYIDFTPQKTGSYLIEGWRSVYRCNDKLDRMVKLQIDHLPFEQRIEFGSDVYRVEITYSDGTRIDRTQVHFPVMNNYE